MLTILGVKFSRISLRMYSKIIIKLVFFLLPYFIFICFITIDRSLPATDGANYLTNAFQYKNIFLDEGVKTGLRSLYFVRDWKPTIYPVILFVFTLIPLQDLELYAAIIQVTFFIFLNISSYFLLRNFCTKYTALLISSGLLISQLVFNWANSLFAEILTLALFLSWLNFIIRSRLFASKIYSIASGVTCSIILMIRPGELIIPIIFMYIFIVWKSKKNMNLTSIFILLIFIILTVTNLYWEIFNSNWLLNPNYFTLFIFLAFVFIEYLNKQKHIYLFHSIILSIGLTYMWYLSFFDSLYLWMYETSFGELTKYWNPGTTNTYLNIYQIVSQIQIQLVLIVLSISTVIISNILNKRSFYIKLQKSNFSIELQLLYAAAVFFTLIPLALILITTAVDIRRIIFGMSLLTLISFLKLSSLSLKNVILFLILNYALIFIIFFYPNSKINIFRGGYQSYNSTATQEEIFIRNLERTGIPKNVTIGTYLIYPEILDVHRLNLVSMLKKSEFRFSYYWKYDNFDQNLNDLRLHNKASYLLLNSNDPSLIKPNWDLYGKLSQRFIGDFTVRFNKNDGSFSRIEEFYLSNKIFSLFQLN